MSPKAITIWFSTRLAAQSYARIWEFPRCQAYDRFFMELPAPFIPLSLLLISAGFSTGFARPAQAASMPAIPSAAPLAPITLSTPAAPGTPAMPGAPTLHAGEVSQAVALDPSDLPRFNFRIRPIALFAGIPGAEIQIGLWPFVSLDSSLQYFASDIGNTNFHVYEVTAALTFFLSGERFHTSWFLEPKSGFLPLTVNGITANSWTISLLAGRYWRLPAGINVSAGAGLAFFSSSASLMVTSGTGLLEIADSGSRTNLEPILEFTVGWGF